MRFLRVGLVLAIAVAGFGVAMSGPALAHDATASGSVGCSTSGSFVITWTITNDFDSLMTAEVSSPSGGLAASSVVVQPWTGGSLTSNTVTQTLPVSFAGQTITLIVSPSWADGATQTPFEVTVTLDPPCAQPEVEVAGISVAEPLTADIPFTG